MNTKDFVNQPHVKEEIASRVNYNPHTGEITWAKNRGVTYFSKTIIGNPVGYKWIDKDGYKNYTVKMGGF